MSLLVVEGSENNSGLFLETEIETGLLPSGDEIIRGLRWRPKHVPSAQVQKNVGVAWLFFYQWLAEVGCRSSCPTPRFTITETKEVEIQSGVNRT